MPTNAPDGLSGLAELMEQGPGDPGPGADPEVRRRRRRRGLLITAIVLVAVMLGSGGYVAWAAGAPLGTPTAEAEVPTAPAGTPARIVLPDDGASAISIAGADAYLGAEASGIWATSGTDEPRPIASLTKIVTALVILEAKPLADADDPGPTIWFDEADHDLYDRYYVQGATIAAMPEGSSLSQYDALATMLIPSASNYADALATWAFGSHGAFRDATRRWLEAHGLTSTRIVEPTGLDPRNVSTPSDMIALGKLAAADPVVARITATPSISLPSTGTLYNTNGLLGREGITGLKTGNLGEYTANLLYTARVDVGAEEPLSVTGVVLGGYSRDSVATDVLQLIASIDNGFQRIDLAARGTELGTITTAWGSAASIVLGEGASIFTWSDTPITVDLTLDGPDDYVHGEEIGTVTWTAGAATESVPVRILGEIEPPTLWWRLTHPAELG